MRRLILFLLIGSSGCASTNNVGIWHLNRNRAPFEGVTLLEKRGEISIDFRERYYMTGTIVQSTLLISPKIVAIDFPQPRQRIRERDLAFRMQGKIIGNDRICVVPGLTIDNFKNRSILLIPHNYLKRILQDIRSNEYQTLYIYLGKFPNVPPDNLRAFANLMVNWAFKFDLTGGREAIRIFKEQ